MGLIVVCRLGNLPNNYKMMLKSVGLLFPHGDSKALANEIMVLENAPEKYISVADACRQRASQFDISKMVESYAELYKSL